MTITRTVTCDKCRRRIDGDWNEVHVTDLGVLVYHVCRSCWPVVRAEVFSIFGGRAPQ